MVHRNVIRLLAIFLAMASALSHSHMHHQHHSRGRKLFGGYRISPKICQPTNPGRIKSDAPAICMFNYECSRRRGEVVGACMDGFLFGACCQLPDKQAADTLEKVPPAEDPAINVHEIDHVPDIPILLNPDGTPMGGVPYESTTKSGFTSTKITSTSLGYNKDSHQNAEKPQLVNSDLAHLEEGYSALLGADHVLDDLKLPSLLTVPDANNDIQQPQALLNPDQIFQVADPVDQLPALFSHGLHRNVSYQPSAGAETVLLNKNGTTLVDDESNDPDEVFRPSTETSFTISTQPIKLETKSAQTSPYTQSTTRTTQKMASTTRTASSHSSTKKGKPSTHYKTSSTKKGSGTTPMAQKQKPTTHAPAKTSTSGLTTPIALTTRNKDEYYTTIYPYGGNSGNKKHDELDKEEIAINHIISILNDTNDAKITTQVTNGPTTYNWVSPDGVSQVKIITARPGQSTTQGLSSPPGYQSPAASPNYYHYSTGTTEPSRVAGSYYTSPHYGSSSTYGGGSSYRPTTNQPAPTVIVLGPYGTEYSTVPTPPTRLPGVTHKYPSSNTNRPLLITKKPLITHNISTIVTSNNNNNKQHIVQQSFVQIHVKDGTTSRPISVSSSTPGTSNIKLVTKRPGAFTTFSSWNPEKPSFHLKPSSPSFNWPGEHQGGTRPGGLTTPGATNCDEPQTAPSSDDINNFPPVRHPELPNNEKDKPTEIITEDEIPTPDFVEDVELNNKVDVFVNKIVQSLQGNFQSLQDVVYNPKNASTIIGQVVTKRPLTTLSATTKRPSSTRPTVKATRRPSTKLTSTTPRPLSSRPKPTSAPTRKPSTTRRTKPIKKATTPLSDDYETTTYARPIETTTGIPEITPNADFRKICGVRPLVKQGRIVGGKGATFGEWPWQVLVREATWLGLFTKNKCGGVLITDKYVITAAHCQPGFLASLVAVFGEHDISGELESRRSVSRNVRRVIVHKNYDPATFANDLALLELETPIQFDVHIVPICMPDDGADFTGRTATVTGWGRLKYNGGVPSVLQEVKVPIMENPVCQEMFQTAGHSKLILDSFMCAGYANGQKDSCEGDSGGPLTMQRADGRWILVGTVSHGIKCAAPYLPGVYMRTTYFKPWLHGVTGV